MNGFTFGGSSNVLPDYNVESPFGTTKSRETSLLEALTRMQAGGFTPPAGMLTATGGYEQPPEPPPDDLRGGLYDWFIENASDFPIEDAEWLLETFGVSIEDIPAFIETATLEQLGALNTYKNVIQAEGWSDLSDWEKDRAFLEAGLPDIYGTAGQQPETSEPPATDVGEVENLLGGIRGQSQTQAAITKLKDKFPSWEDLWSVLSEAIPTDSKDIGEAIRTVLDAAGVNLPTANPMDILKGGYGVIWDPASSVWTAPGTGNIFIPGLPAGLPPSSVVIGSIEDLIADPVGTITQKVQDIFGGVIADPGGFVKDILSGAADLPPGVWDIILGGVTAGQGFYDWLKENGYLEGDDTDTTVGGTEDPDPSQDAASFDRIKQTEDLLGQFTTGFPEPEPEPETEPFDRTKQVESLLGQFTTGLPEPEPEPEPDPLAGGDGGGTADAENLLSIFTNAFDDTTNGDEEEDSLLSTIRNEILKDDDDDDDDDDFTFGGTAVVTDEPEPEPPDPFTGGGGGGGGAGSVGGGSGQAEEFMRGLSYQPLQVPNLIQTPFVNFAAGLTPQPMSKTQQFMRNSITGSLFGDYI